MFGGSGNFFVWKLLLPLLLYGILEWCSPLFPFGGLCNAILVCWIDDRCVTYIVKHGLKVDFLPENGYVPVMPYQNEKKEITNF